MTSSDRANLLEKGAEPRPPTPSKKPTVTTKKLALSISGVFVLYVLHDALQERAFRQPGFRFGWFMTLIEIVVVSACAFAFEWGAPPDPTVVSEGAKEERITAPDAHASSASKRCTTLLLAPRSVAVL